MSREPGFPGITGRRLEGLGSCPGAHCCDSQTLAQEALEVWGPKSTGSNSPFSLGSSCVTEVPACGPRGSPCLYRGAAGSRL